MTTYTENCSRSIVAAAAGATLGQIFRHWIRNQQLKYRIYQERRQLLEMSDQMLKDLGISRIEAEAEAARSDIPAQRFLRRDC